MYQSDEMLAVKKLLDKLIKPKHPNIIRFDVRAYDTDKLGSIPQIYTYLKEHDDDDELNIDLEKFINRFNSKTIRVFNKITFKNFVNSFFKSYSG